MKRLKKDKPNKIPYLFAGLLIAVVLFFAIVGIFGGEGSYAPEASVPGETEQESPKEQVDGLDMGSGLRLIQAGRYSGMFVEDGSDEIVQDILAITVENTGDRTVQLAAVTLTAKSGETYHFELTTLPPGEKVAVLEQNRAAFDADMEIAAAVASGVAMFEEEPTLCEDVLEFTCVDRSVSIKNISDKGISGGRVFYKSMSGTALVGGITYMLTVPALKAGQEVTIAAGHYMDGASRLMFATYAN